MTVTEMYKEIFNLCEKYGYERVEKIILSILGIAKDCFEEKEKLKEILPSYFITLP